MHTAEILSCLALIVLVLTDNQTNITQSTYINMTDCTFNYNSNNSSFLFIDCKSPLGNTTNWFLCLTRCCSNIRSIDYTKPNLLAITQCKETTVESSSSVGVIVMGVLIAGFAMIVIVCFCVVTWRVFGAFQMRSRMVINMDVSNEV